LTAPHLVVVGASLAGLRAVESARRTGYDGPITLIGAEPHLPYDRPPLSKDFLQSTHSGLPTEHRSEQHLREALSVDLRLGAPATLLDTDARLVTLEGGATVPYTALVIATGVNARRLPGTEHLAGVHALRTLDDAQAIRTALDAGARHVVIVGAGFIGSEVAAAIRNRGLRVTILEAGPVPLARAVGEEMGALCARIHERHGTALRCGIGLESVEGDSRVRRVRLTDGTSLDADLVIVGIGGEPATGWLEDSGLRLDNGVVCDETLWAGADGVYAAGDIARWDNPMFDQQMRLEHWTTSAEQGAAAARNALSPSEATPFATVPYFWSDWYDQRLQFVGLPAADEVRMAIGDSDSETFLAVYRRGDRVTGALGLDQRKLVMRLRGMIAARATWEEAMEFIAQSHSSAALAT
jgi:NADPH-dependent 2,4-dienoyl-CoA reductase/sulfur reductase-like enzyme